MGDDIVALRIIINLKPVCQNKKSLVNNNSWCCQKCRSELLGFFLSAWLVDIPGQIITESVFDRPTCATKNVKIFIIKGFQTIVFIFIVISTTFRPMCPPGFFRCLSNSRTFTELRTSSFIECTGVACSYSFSHNRVQVLSIPVLLLACGQDWTCNLLMIVSFRSLGNQRL